MHSLIKLLGKQAESNKKDYIKIPAHKKHHLQRSNP